MSQDAAMQAQVRMMESQLLSKEFWHPDASRKEAEDFLKNAKPGAFMIRRSSNMGYLALSHRLEDGAFGHALIMWDGSGYTLENANKSYSVIEDLIKSLNLRLENVKKKRPRPAMVLGHPVMFQVEVLCTYHARSDGELTAERADVINVIGQEPGYYYGELEGKGGRIPSGLTKKVPGSDVPPPGTPQPIAGGGILSPTARQAFEQQQAAAQAGPPRGPPVAMAPIRNQYGTNPAGGAGPAGPPFGGGAAGAGAAGTPPGRAMPGMAAGRGGGGGGGGMPPRGPPQNKSKRGLFGNKKNSAPGGKQDYADPANLNIQDPGAAAGPGLPGGGNNSGANVVAGLRQRQQQLYGQMSQLEAELRTNVPPPRRQQLQQQVDALRRELVEVDTAINAADGEQRMSYMYGNAGAANPNVHGSGAAGRFATGGLPPSGLRGPPMNAAARYPTAGPTAGGAGPGAPPRAGAGGRPEERAYDFNALQCGSPNELQFEELRAQRAFAYNGATGAFNRAAGGAPPTSVAGPGGGGGGGPPLGGFRGPGGPPGGFRRGPPGAPGGGGAPPGFPRPPPGTQFVVYGRALADFQGESEGELSFRQGDTIGVLEKGNDGWWKGVDIGGQCGWLPGNGLQEIPGP